MIITTNDILELIANCKTISGRKARLTKLIKEQMEYFNDVQNAYKRGNGLFGWLHGEKIYQHTVQDERINLNRLEKYRQSLNK